MENNLFFSQTKKGTHEDQEEQMEIEEGREDEGKEETETNEDEGKERKKQRKEGKGRAREGIRHKINEAQTEIIHKSK